MAGPQNAILSEDFGINPPITEVNPIELAEEQKAAKYSKSHEYKKLKAHFESRVEFYQQYLPDGREITELPKNQRDDMWLVANAVIRELKSVMNYYETAKEAVEKNV